ncbi:MAG: hypothetical protein EOO04_36300 [Chitinophagaceae bacterium]|nr:MAG: hypothetical protein EOO04_36300 [Chitinophagaceae bacterium]
MISLHTREETLALFPQLPTSNYSTDAYTYPETFRTYILGLDTIQGDYGALLSQELFKLCTLMNVASMVFIGDSETPWNPLVDNESRYEKYFSNLLPDAQFNGAISVTNDDLPAFFQPLFELVTQNMSQPVTYFMDTHGNLLGNICSYGNIHIDLLKTDIQLHFEKSVSETRLIKIPAGACGQGQFNSPSRSMRI